VNPYLFALIYAGVVAAVVPIGLTIFKTPHAFIDVLLAAVGGAAFSLIPTLGGVASEVATVGILFWRTGRDLFPDIIVSVAVARLAVIPVGLLVMLK
jgi:hypothetical protein